MYWDDNVLTVEPYERKQKKYFCGRRLDKVERTKTILSTVLVIDLEEVYCANIYNDGEIEKVFEFNSEVPSKHHSGGQSAQRFARVREGAIIHYFKKINDKLKEVNTNFIVGMNFIYRNQFESYLSTPNKNKLLEYRTIEYGGISGVYQLRNELV